MLRVKRNGVPAIYPKEFRYIKPFVQMRDKNICCGCGKNLYDKKRYFHHIDANVNNNKITNIATVCGKCHGSVHSIGIIKVKINKKWKIPKIKKQRSLLPIKSNLRFKGT